MSVLRQVSAPAAELGDVVCLLYGVVCTQESRKVRQDPQVPEAYGATATYDILLKGRQGPDRHNRFQM